MPFVRTRISVSGFKQEEVCRDLPDLLDEFRQRPYLLEPQAFWDASRQRLAISVAVEGDDPRIEGGFRAAILDIVWDCVIACVNFSSGGIEFHVEDSVVLTDL